jgi:hypothetical protein
VDERTAFVASSEMMSSPLATRPLSCQPVSIVATCARAMAGTEPIAPIGGSALDSGHASLRRAASTVPGMITPPLPVAEPGRRRT